MVSVRNVLGLLITCLLISCGEAQQNPCSVICSYEQLCDNRDPQANAVDNCLNACKPAFEQASVRCKDYYREFAGCLGKRQCANRNDCTTLKNYINDSCGQAAGPTAKPQITSSLSWGANL